MFVILVLGISRQEDQELNGQPRLHSKFKASLASYDLVSVNEKKKVFGTAPREECIPVYI